MQSPAVACREIEPPSSSAVPARKNRFALQTLVNGARQFGEPGIFVAFEENSRHILANAASFGWNLPKLEKKQLFFFDAKMGPDVIKAGEFDLSGMLAGIKAEADARGARRIVFDAVDVLLSLLDDPLRSGGRFTASTTGSPRAA
jgi:RecA-superfamily ATPases implicated in signal transduction